VAAKPTWQRTETIPATRATALRDMLADLGPEAERSGFTQQPLDRGDIEWLLVATGDGKGSLGTIRIGGANLQRKDLSDLPLPRADFRGVELTGADLRRADLSAADMRGANLGRYPVLGAKHARADLRHAHLGGADLRGADLTGADLRKAFLAKANLRGANLTDADLRDTDLTHADFRGALLAGASLEGADLTAALLGGADIRRARLDFRTRLTHARLFTPLPGIQTVVVAPVINVNVKAPEAPSDGTDLRGVNLAGVDLRALNLRNADVRGSDLHGADLSGADMTGALLWGADFSGANLQGTCLARAELQGASFAATQFQRTDLSGALINGVDLEPAKLDFRTRLTWGRLFTRPSATNCARIADLMWNGANVADIADWSEGQRLGDDPFRGVSRWPAIFTLWWMRSAWPWISHRSRREAKPPDTPKPHKLTANLEEAIRANRQASVVLKTQGLPDYAGRYDLRASQLARRLLPRLPLWVPGRRNLSLFLHPIARFASFVIDLVSGYGYKPWRLLAAYIITVGIFAAIYNADTLSIDSTLPHGWNAIWFSVVSFHGRGIVNGGIGPTSPVMQWAALESALGLAIEALLVATLIRKLFRD